MHPSLPRFASTDGWTTCSLGHRHWGRAGAAGLLLHRDGPRGVELLLQHRAGWSHHGGTWGTPGGALHAGEPAEVGALREVREELGLLPDDVVLGVSSVDDHGGWSYTTVLARSVRGVEPGDLRLDGESEGVAWVPLTGLDRVPVHPGLAASLDRLRPLLTAATRVGQAGVSSARTRRWSPTARARTSCDVVRTPRPSRWSSCSRGSAPG